MMRPLTQLFSEGLHTLRNVNVGCHKKDIYLTFGRNLKYKCIYFYHSHLWLVAGCKHPLQLFFSNTTKQTHTSDIRHNSLHVTTPPHTHKHSVMSTQGHTTRDTSQCRYHFSMFIVYSKFILKTFSQVQTDTTPPSSQDQCVFITQKYGT